MHLDLISQPHAAAVPFFLGNETVKIKAKPPKSREQKPQAAATGVRKVPIP
jgi:hypothetical protein